MHLLIQSAKNLINSHYLNNMFAVLNIHMIDMQSGMLFCSNGVIPGFVLRSVYVYGMCVFVSAYVSVRFPG